MTITTQQAQLCVDAAQRVVEQAASELGMSRRKVARRYRRGRKQDAEVVTTVLRLAAAESVAIDPDNLRAILEIILEFIKALFDIFS
jgi:AraC-like DNA-binding protein